MGHETVSEATRADARATVERKGNPLWAVRNCPTMIATTDHVDLDLAIGQLDHLTQEVEDVRRRIRVAVRLARGFDHLDEALTAWFCEYEHFLKQLRAQRRAMTSVGTGGAPLL